MTADAPGRSSRRIAAVLLVIYLAAAAVVLLAPVSYGAVIHSIARVVGTLPGVRGFGSGWIEFTANIVLFLPMGFLITVLTRRPWIGALVGITTSIGVELAQIHIPDRDPMVRDVISNSIGSILGALIAWLAVLRPRRRRARAA